MKNLFLLIKGLSQKEISLVNSYLLVNREGPQSKLLKLFNFLLDLNELPEPDQVSYHLYKRKSDNTFEKLCSRLNARILDILISSANIENSELEHFNLMSINIRKKLAQFYQLYYSKGNYDLVTKELLDDIILKSKKYELYSPLIEALQFKKILLGFSKGLDEFNRVDSEMVFYTNCLNWSLKAIDYYFIMTMYQNFGKNKSQFEDFLKKSIKKLNQYFAQTKSAIVGYYLKQLELAYFSNREDFFSCRDICNDLIELLNKNKSIFLKSRISYVLDNYAKFEVYLSEYPNAIIKSRDAQVYHGGDTINFLLSKEVEFYALFYSRNFQEAFILVDSILKNEKIRARDSFRYSKFIFYKANLLFQIGDFKETLKILNQNLEISRDKVGWEIPLRILSICCSIELKSFLIADSQVEAFRTHIRRHTVKEIGKRNLTINKFLYGLSRANFDFSKCNSLETINLLSSDQKNIKWSHFTPELIPFQDWLKSKI